MTDQLILKFPKKNIYLREDFYVSSSDQEAYDFINSWPKWFKKICVLQKVMTRTKLLPHIMTYLGVNFTFLPAGVVLGL